MQGYSDEDTAKKFEADGEENLAASGILWTENDIKKIRTTFNLARKKKPLSEIRIAAFFLVLFFGGLASLFMAFVCNGGAGGSSQLSAKAGSCLTPYLTVYFVALVLIIAVRRR